MDTEQPKHEVGVSAAPASASRADVPLAYALGALQLVVTLGWSAYRHFQPILLERFDLAAFSTPLAFYLGLGGSTLAPLVGALGDRVARRGGPHVPLFVAGGILAGAIFVAVAATVASGPGSNLRWILLVLIALWIAAMTVLQTPALALLPRAAVAARLPIVASPLVMATVLPTALWPLVQRALDGLGGPFVFVAGGVAIVLATLALRHALQVPEVASAGDTRLRTIKPARPSVVFLAGAFVVGAVSAFVTHVAAQVVPVILASRFGNGEVIPALLSATTLGASTVLAPGLARLGVAAGTRGAVLASLVVTTLCAVTAPFCTSIVTVAAVAVVTGGALALHLDCALPLTFELLPPDAAGLAAGLYLGGIFAGSQLASLPALLA